MFDRPDSGETAVLVSLAVGRGSNAYSLPEFHELALAAGVQVVAAITGKRKSPDARYYIGAGKAEELRDVVRDTSADIVLVDHPLSPGQERNLERLLQCRVVERTGVILDIFAQRAKSHEGKLQVELAQLQHLSTRLVRGWTHLERQKGGIGLRGPGETQLETDRRLIGRRIRQLNTRLAKLSSQRRQGRRARRKAQLPLVSLVGYTNAGKSTVFNWLSGADAYAADLLFATLDTTLRRIELPDTPPLVVSDTVGFIRDLPHDLVAAFQATLEETRNADLLLVVTDAADENSSERTQDVRSVLTEIGADSIPQILVYNKIDVLEECEPRIDYDADGRIRRVWVSAATGTGMDLLQRAISDHFARSRGRRWVRVRSTAGKTRAWLYARKAVLQERSAANGDCLLHVSLSEADFAHLNGVTVVTLGEVETGESAAKIRLVARLAADGDAGL